MITVNTTWNPIANEDLIVAYLVKKLSAFYLKVYAPINNNSPLQGPVLSRTKPIYISSNLFLRLPTNIQLTPCSSIILPHKLAVIHLYKKFTSFYGPRSFITAFKSPVICPYPEPDEFSPYYPYPTS